jgi:hypothetical protein
VTLILNHINHAWALQMTDRLVSRAATPYDPEANKNLVFLTDFAAVAIGHSGLSYLEGIPTDEWIAQTLLGERVSRWPGGGPAMSRGRLAARTRRRCPGRRVYGYLGRVSTDR